MVQISCIDFWLISIWTDLNSNIDYNIEAYVFSFVVDHMQWNSWFQRFYYQTEFCMELAVSVKVGWQSYRGLPIHLIDLIEWTFWLCLGFFLTRIVWCNFQKVKLATWCVKFGIMSKWIIFAPKKSFGISRHSIWFSRIFMQALNHSYPKGAP